MKYEGTCSCGAVHVGLLTEPLMKYNCHCSICRRTASKYSKEKKPYHTGVFVWRWTAVVHGDVEYERTTAMWGLFQLSRGRCKNCKDPVWEPGGRMLLPYAMVMAPPLDIIPDTNIHYDSGYKEGPHDMKVTINSDMGSLAYELWILLTVGLPMLPYSIFAWHFQPKLKEKV